MTWPDGSVGVASPQILFELLAESYGHQAMHDPLTGLANRALLIDRLRHALLAARRSHARPTVLFLDLDDFKSVNDTLGHDHGDGLLIAVAERLQEVVRPGDTLARMGGDEFAVLLTGETNLDAGTKVAARLLAAIEKGFVVGDDPVRITASIGVVWADSDATSQSLLRKADVAMYEAKRVGAGQCRVYDAELHESDLDRRRLATDLRRAAAGQLRLEFQPVVSVPDLRWTGLEALVRWRHPERGLLMPDAFIGLAEQVNLIAEIDGWVLREACRQLGAWRSGTLGHPLRIAVNLSASNFDSPHVVDTVSQVLEEGGLSPELLEIEVTETVAVGNGSRVERCLHELRQLGVRVTMDDFGVGHSSLSRLVQFPLDAVKIDRSFVQAIDSGRAERKLVSALIATCHELDLEVVAEGVERRSQLEFLIERGCDLAQGILFGPPAVSEAIELALAEPHAGISGRSN